MLRQQQQHFQHHHHQQQLKEQQLNPSFEILDIHPFFRCFGNLAKKFEETILMKFTCLTIISGHCKSICQFVTSLFFIKKILHSVHAVGSQVFI